MLLPYLWLGTVSSFQSSFYWSSNSCLILSFSFWFLLNHILLLACNAGRSSAIYSASKPQLTEAVCICLWFLFFVFFSVIFRYFTQGKILFWFYFRLLCRSCGKCSGALLALVCPYVLSSVPVWLAVSYSVCVHMGIISQQAKSFVLPLNRTFS